MIVVLFGQPHSGKSTLAHELLKSEHLLYPVNIDGDSLRELFINKDFSREGRMKNLNRASDIAVYLNSIQTDVILSLVYPYAEARKYLDDLCNDVKWVYLTYQGERGREKNHVKDFEIPEEIPYITIDTSKLTIEESTNIINEYIKDL